MEYYTLLKRSQTKINKLRRETLHRNKKPNLNREHLGNIYRHFFRFLTHETCLAAHNNINNHVILLVNYQSIIPVPLLWRGVIVFTATRKTSAPPLYYTKWLCTPFIIIESYLITLCLAVLSIRGNGTTAASSSSSRVPL